MPFFVNVTALSKEQVAKHDAKAKVGNFMRMGSFLGTMATDTVDSQATGERFAREVAELVTLILRARGLTVSVSIIFVKGLFIVLRVSVMDPSIGRAPPPTQKPFDPWEAFGCCGVCKLDGVEKVDPVAAVEFSCVSRLGDALKDKLEEEGVQTVVRCCSEVEESAHLDALGFRDVWLPGKATTHTEFMVRPSPASGTMTGVRQR
mmetsp:Transcript_19937/g.48538  ORF Transcript_19937/g.48538 Transcript_19937/m.48538 type:complete len:205 (-) Transcript_19937:351-965(-)